MCDLGEHSGAGHLCLVRRGGVHIRSTEGLTDICMPGFAPSLVCHSRRWQHWKAGQQPCWHQACGRCLLPIPTPHCMWTAPLVLPHDTRCHSIRAHVATASGHSQGQYTTKLHPVTRTPPASFACHTRLAHSCTSPCQSLSPLAHLFHTPLQAGAAGPRQCASCAAA